MYEAFFNFTAKPFDLLPNPDLLFMSSSHGKALSYLRYGIEERAGFILLSGEVGAGKTTLIRELIKNHLDNMILSKVFNTKADSHQLMTMINDDFGLETEGRSKAILIRELNEFLIDQYALGKRAVLIIDEAQNLTPELLEEVRMLSNLETDGGKLMQIILVGQPELRDTLKAPELLQLRQRIQFSCHLKPLNHEEIAEYIFYRMECVGNRGALEFSDEAMEKIHDLTRGIPRLVNILCDYLLIDAFINERRDISLSDVTEISEELDFEAQYWDSAVPQAPSEPVVSVATGRRAKKLPNKAARVLKRINDLESRIDFLEREAARTNNNAMASLLDRLEALEKNMNFQQEGLESVKAMYWNAAAGSQMESVRGAESVTAEPMKRGWVHKWLFGRE